LSIDFHANIVLKKYQTLMVAFSVKLESQMVVQLMDKNTVQAYMLLSQFYIN